MLFIIYHRHTAEMCPGGKVHADKEFLAKIKEQIRNAGVKLIEGYLDGPGHQFYFVIETDDSTKLNTAIEQLRLVGDINDTLGRLLDGYIQRISNALNRGPCSVNIQFKSTTKQ